MVKLSHWCFNDKQMKYEITANRFLHHMVRLLVGTMIEVARERISLNQFKKLLSNKDIDNIPIVKSPAKGLFLNEIKY